MRPSRAGQLPRRLRRRDRRPVHYPTPSEDSIVKRASYRDAIDFIACNDEPTETDPEEVRGLASVLLVASIFGVDTERVAKDVVRYRKKHNIVP